VLDDAIMLLKVETRVILQSRTIVILYLVDSRFCLWSQKCCTISDGSNRQIALERGETTKDLGVWFDEKLNFKNICKTKSELRI